MPFRFDYIGRVHEFGGTKWYPTENWSKVVENKDASIWTMTLQVIDSISIPIEYVFYFHWFLVFVLLIIVLSDMGGDYDE
jgi:hypothetical protein